MRIAVNTRLLLKDRLEGIGWFTHETLSRIALAHPEHQFLFIFDRPFDPSFIYAPNVEGIVCAPPARHPLLFYIWFEWRLPSLLEKLKADLFLSPDGYLSLRSKLPQIAVIHDLNFEHAPLDIPWAPRWHFRYFFPKYAARANRIATVSEFSKADVVSTYSIDPEKIDVVYNGVNESYLPFAKDAKEAVRAEFSSGQPYFLFVGAIHPRKNLLNQLKAFSLFRESNSENYQFLVVGESTARNGEMSHFLEINQFSKDIRFLGRRSLQELIRLYGAAEALMYVSKFEGFGIPIIEAFRAGTPVITATTSSMPEVAGGAALLVDPGDETAIANAMKKIAEDRDFIKELITKGLSRSEKFNWDATAELLWKSIIKVQT